MHPWMHRGDVKRKSHRGNSRLRTVNEKPACQDVPHSRINKIGSLSYLWHSRLTLHGEKNRKMNKWNLLAVTFYTFVFPYLADTLAVFLSLHLFSHNSCKPAFWSAVFSFPSTQRTADRMRLSRQRESFSQGCRLAHGCNPPTLGLLWRP